MKRLVILLIDFYRIFLSFDCGILRILVPGGACRYSPSCSLYTKQMIEKYGILTGLYFGGKRVLTCK